MNKGAATAGGAVLLALLGIGFAPAADGDCASLRARAASAQAGGPAQLRLADEREVACARGVIAAAVPTVERTTAASVRRADTRAHLDRLLEDVTPGGPAHFRLIEERDKLSNP